MLALRPDFATAAKQEYAKWFDEEHVEQVIEGLRKAGLQMLNNDFKSEFIRDFDYSYDGK